MLLVSIVSNNLSNYGRRHFELFTSCHVSWDTLYLQSLKSDLNQINLSQAKCFLSSKERFYQDDLRILFSESMNII